MFFFCTKSEDIKLLFRFSRMLRPFKTFFFLLNHDITVSRKLSCPFLSYNVCNNHKAWHSRNVGGKLTIIFLARSGFLFHHLVRYDSLRKHPFLLPLRRWGRFVFCVSSARNVPSGEEGGETGRFRRLEIRRLTSAKPTGSTTPWE